MGRFIWCALLLSGCSTPISTAQVIVDDALLVRVASDDSMVATIRSSSASTLDQLEGTSDGELSVQVPTLGPLTPATTWVTTPVDTDVSRVLGFADGYLLYGVDHTRALDGTFKPMAWKAGLQQPIALSYEPIAAVGLTGGPILYFGTGPTSGTLSTLRLTDCDDTHCQPIEIGQSGTYSPSDDGTQCVFQNAVDDGVDFFYFNYAQGAPTKIGHVDSADVAGLDLVDLLLVRFSFDDSRIALMAPGGGVEVLATDNLSTGPMAWAPLPAGASLLGMVFPDPSILMLRLATPDGSFVYRSTPSETTRLIAADSFRVVYDANNQLTGLFVAAGTPYGYAVSAFSFASGNTTAVDNWTTGLPVISNDGAMAYVLDNYSVDDDQGILQVFDSASLFLNGQLDLSSAGISNENGVAFIPDSHELIYFDQYVLSAWNPDVGPVSLAANAVRFETTRSRQLYFETANDQYSVGSAGHTVQVRPL